MKNSRNENEKSIGLKMQKTRNENTKSIGLKLQNLSDCNTIIKKKRISLKWEFILYRKHI